MDVNVPYLNLLIPAAIILIALFSLGLVFARLYHRASKEIAFVRTGLGGEKVVRDGGALVLPVMHETIPVNMNTLKLEVLRAARRGADHASDRMRVDVQAEFYVRVQAGCLRDRHRRADAGPPHHGPGGAEGADRRQVRRRPARGRGRDEHGGTAREPRRLRAEGAGRRSPRICTRTASNWNRSR